MAKGFGFATAALIALACGLCVSTYATFGHTWDEPEHLAAGMQLLDHGEYTYDIQHPPLARLAMAIGPYLAGARSFGEPGPSGDQEGRDLLYRTGNYDRILTLARLGVLPFLAILLLAARAWAKHLLGDVAAVFTVIFIATTPTVLGHAGLAALDMPGAALCALALYLLVRWIESPAWQASALFGIAAGLAVATKLSAIPFLIVCTAVVGALRWALGPADSQQASGSRVRYAGGAAVALAGAIVAVVLAYGGRFERLLDDTHRSNPALDYIAAPGTAGHDLLYAVAARVPVPVAAEKLTLGIKELNKHNREGHLSFLLGEVKKTGWWYFYPVALAVKTPLPVLLLGLAGLALLAAGGVHRRDWRLLAPPACFAAILLFCCVYSRINIGVRHILVLYPLLAIGAAHAVARAWEARSRWPARAGVAALLTWQAGTLWVSYPDYLAYFNESVGNHPEAVLIDSDLDWGQDMRRLEKELKARQVKSLSFVFRGTEDWIREDLPPFTYLPPNLPTTGWVAVDLLAKLIVDQDHDGYAWLEGFRPVTRVGKTIDLYFIPPEK